ncbi:MAG: hypothetical protein KC502_07835, partial [Myxococcales bacterium]|nr:hypothetical protein [Myxococcales bacterium]
MGIQRQRHQRILAKHRLALLSLFFSFGLGNSALAAEKRCNGAAPTHICKAFEAAPKADVNAKTTQAVIAVWKKLEAPFAALTGRSTGMTVLSDKARFHGKPFPPAAYICPGAPPVVYVPHTLVDRVLVT